MDILRCLHNFQDDRHVISQEAAGYLDELYRRWEIYYKNPNEPRIFISHRMTAATLTQYFLRDVYNLNKRLPARIVLDMLSLVQDNQNDVMTNLIRPEIDYLRDHCHSYWHGVANIGEEGWNYNLDIFRTGKPQQRVRAFSNLRFNNPERALKVLQEVWKNEPARIRTLFATEIYRCKHDIIPSDAPFLDYILEHDRSKLVREKIKEVVSYLPNSQYCQDLTARAKKLLRYEMKDGQAKVVITLPTEPFENLNFCYAPQHYTHPMSNLKKEASFIEIISRVPLSTWSTTADLTEWLKASSNNEQALLIHGFTNACLHFQDIDHANILFGERDTIHKLLGAKLYKVVSAENKVQILSSALKAKPQYIDWENVRILLCDADDTLPWEEETLDKIVLSLGCMLPTWYERQQYSYSKALLGNLALTLPFYIRHRCAEIAPQDKNHYLYHYYSDFLNILELRENIYQALKQ